MLILIENSQVHYCQIALILQVQKQERGHVLNKQYALHSKLRLSMYTVLGDQVHFVMNLAMTCVYRCTSNSITI